MSGKQWQLIAVVVIVGICLAVFGVVSATSGSSAVGMREAGRAGQYLAQALAVVVVMGFIVNRVRKSKRDE